jgi:transposase
LDPSAILFAYEQEGRGHPLYHLLLMAKALLYGYCVGVYSSRRTALKLAEDVWFLVVAGNSVDHIGRRDSYLSN